MIRKPRTLFELEYPNGGHEEQNKKLSARLLSEGLTVAFDPVLRNFNGNCFWGRFIKKHLYARAWGNLDIALASIGLENVSMWLPQERHYRVGTQVPVKHDQLLALAIPLKSDEFGRQLILYGLFNAINNSYNHALSRFPGPPTASFSNLSYSRRFLSGQQPYEMLDIHNKYGPIVRIAPNELSFSSFEAWRDMHGFRSGHQTFIKGEFYEGGSFAGQGIKSLVSERNPKEHAKMRKYLSHAFSDRSLKEQEFLISEVVDQFVNQIGIQGAPSGEGIDLVKWFNLTTFDIITSLAFGDSFKG
ncbi:MAG: hypothetical protein Q9212_004747 [Teloschistes hypoglaucus]